MKPFPSQRKDPSKIASRGFFVGRRVGKSGANLLAESLRAPLMASLPPQLRVGIDVVEVNRIRESLARFGERFERRLFTDDEVAYARAAPVQQAERLAARFAAKEATIKALSFSEAGVDWRDMEVCRGAQGECELVLYGRANTLARARGVTQLRLSLTHDGDYAGAVVVAALSDTTGDAASAESLHEQIRRTGDSANPQGSREARQKR